MNKRNVLTMNCKQGPKDRALSKKRRRFFDMALAGMAVVSGASVMPIGATALAANCAPPSAGAPMYITADCTDPRFNQPYVDVDELRTDPVPHRYVHGGFTGTDAKFSFYFPSADKYDGRFFQITHQLLASENTEPYNIGLGVASGAYFVQTNLGGRERATTTEQAVFGNLDPAIGGYRVNAAAAKFSRVKAAEIYGGHHTHGYLYGGSGGAYQVIASAENSTGVWDGYVPYVMGTPNSIPGVFTVRIHALRILRQRNKLPDIMDAIEPGGSGNPYAGLNAEERGALREATLLGFPPRGWWNHPTLSGGPLALVAGFVPYLDPTYFTDYWTKPGYLGHDDPTGSVAAARIQHSTSISSVVNFPPFPKGVVVASLPSGDLTGADLLIESGAAKGKQLSLFGVVGGVLAISFGADPAIVNSLAAGDQVRIDNSSYLALQTYHRHQVLTPDFYGWNQFRAADGTPIYPQRDVAIGPISALGAAGSLQSGRFHGKMIAVENLMDIDAFAWQADWYRTKVKQAFGRNIEQNFRLWFTDYAQHVPPADVAAQAHTVSYQGVLEQALRDVSAWVEKGTRPPSSTNYDIVNTQVEVPELAILRGGIQPVVHLRANGHERADVAVGEPVTFFAVIQVPLRAGKVVAAEWDFEGLGTYPVVEPLRDAKSTAILKTKHVFTQPGTYFPVLRATSQRQGDMETPYARVQNLGRVRVVVK
jgi:hypothetical protein